ncbi:MAG: 50S ribosomal protein L23 [Anaerolineales bacterium]|nr:50S ribosomal protein L23 [Anaerolineales bacterium]
MSNFYNVLVRPLVTEKTNRQSGKLGQYAFVVADKATRTMVKDAVETLFDVTVARVNILNAPAKRSRRTRSRRLLVRRAGYKKAIITLAEGSKPLEIFEGVQ